MAVGRVEDAAVGAARRPPPAPPARRTPRGGGGPGPLRCRRGAPTGRTRPGAGGSPSAAADGGSVDRAGELGRPVGEVEAGRPRRPRRGPSTRRSRGRPGRRAGLGGGPCDRRCRAASRGRTVTAARCSTLGAAVDAADGCMPTGRWTSSHSLLPWGGGSKWSSQWSTASGTTCEARECTTPPAPSSSRVTRRSTASIRSLRWSTSRACRSSASAASSCSAAQARRPPAWSRAPVSRIVSAASPVHGTASACPTSSIGLGEDRRGPARAAAGPGPGSPSCRRTWRGSPSRTGGARADRAAERPGCSGPDARPRRRTLDRAPIGRAGRGGPRPPTAGFPLGLGIAAPAAMRGDTP